MGTHVCVHDLLRAYVKAFWDCVHYLLTKKHLHPCDITCHVLHVRSRTVELLTKARRDGYKFHLTGLVFLWQTLNDVLLAMVDASLHRYLQGRYHKATDLSPNPPPAGISL